MRFRTRVAALFLFSAPLLAAKLSAQGNAPGYLAEMPTVERVMQAMKTADPDETAARQMAAFTHLKNMIEKLAGPRFPKNQLTPEENKLRQAYYTAYWQISKSKPQYGPFTAMRGLDIDIKFRDEVIQKCFPPSFAAEYSKMTGQAIAQNQAFHDQGAAARAEREQARADAAAKQQPNPQDTYAGVQQQLDSVRLQSVGLLTPEQDRCVAAGRPEASCLGNALLGGFTQMISQVLPAAGKQRAPGPTMSGVFAGPGNWRIDFITDGVLVNCAMLSPNQQNYTVKFENGRVLVVINTTPKPLVLTLTADGNLVGPGPVVIDGVIATGYHEGPTNAMYQDAAGNLYDANGNKAFQGAGYSTFSPKQTTCPAQNLSSKGAGTGVETMEFNVLKMAIGADQGPPIPPGVRMSGMFAANTGFNVEFFPESAIVACGQPARAYPYHVVANGSQTAIKIDDPTHPLLLNFRPDGALDPGSGSYLVHGRRIVGKDVHDNFTFAPLEGTCNLGVLVPGAVAGPAPAQINASAGSGAVSGGLAGGSPGTAPAAAALGPSGARIAAPGAPTGNAVLSIVSGLQSQPNSPNPLASGLFVLERDTYANVFSRAGIQVPPGTTPQLVQYNACSQRTPDCQRTLQAFQGNVAAAARPDALGKATFAGVPPGTYYVVASASYNNQKIYWELKVDLKAGANAATLDERNGNLLYPNTAARAGGTPPKPAANPAAPPPNPAAQPESSRANIANEFAKQGLDYYNAKDYPEAIEAFNRALALDPNTSDAAMLYAGSGAAYFESKQYDKAVASLREALRRKSDNEDTWWLLGMSLYHLKQYSSALEALQKAAILKPEDERNPYWLGRTHFDTNQYDKAVAALQLATRLKPDNDDSWYWLGVAYWELKQNDKAIASLKESVRLNPQNGGSWSHLGLAYFSSMRFPEAVEATQQSIRIAPNAADYHMLGLCYFYMGKKAEAQDVYQKLLTMDKEEAQELYQDMKKFEQMYPNGAHIGSAAPKTTANPMPQPANSAVGNAVAYIQQGSKDLDAKQYDKAIQAFKSALALDPKMFAAYSGLGRAYVHAGRYKEAVPPLQEAVRLKPDDEISWFMLGAAFNLDGQYQSALQPLEQAVRLNPADAEARKSLGANYNALEQNDKAKEQLQEAVRIDPSDAVSWNLLGKVLFALQQYAESAHALQQALRLNPNDSEADYLQGRNYIELKQNDKAIASLKEAVRIDPKDAASWSYLGLAYFTSEQFPQAAAAVQEEIRLDPDADAYVLLGTCYVYMDKKQEALGVYQKLLTMDKKAASDLYADISKMK